MSQFDDLAAAVTTLTTNVTDLGAETVALATSISDIATTIQTMVSKLAEGNPDLAGQTQQITDAAAAIKVSADTLKSDAAQLEGLANPNAPSPPTG